MAQGTHIREPLGVIAIDFGTTYTGYAFSFKGSEEKIVTAKRGGKLSEDRVPTAILLHPSKSFRSFGFDAIGQYAEMSDQERHRHFYFECFKMLLYRSEGLSRKSVVKDMTNKDINALHVFYLAIRYFKSLAIEIAKLTKLGHFDEKLFKWMITVPAIWDEPSRKFMHEAATLAGIPYENIYLVLEPEAASVFCREQKDLATAGVLANFPVGHKYILADLGGGTADICAHEVLNGGKLRELSRASGGALGGNLVNENFSDFMTKLVGDEVMTDFKKHYLNLYFEMMNEFEKQKKTFSSKTEKMTFSLPHSLVTIIQQIKGHSLEVVVQNSKHRDVASFTDMTERLTLQKDLIKSLFHNPAQGIIKQLKSIILSCKGSDLKTLMLVGGFSDSPYLRERIKEEFYEFEVILHEELRLGVLKGAVRMGYRLQTSCFAYGIDRIECVKKDASTLENRFGSGDREVKWLIEKGQAIKFGDVFTAKGFETTPITERNKIKCTTIWRLGDTNLEKLGSIERKPPTKGWPEVSMVVQEVKFALTGFTVRCSNQDTGQTHDGYFSF